MPNHNKSKLLRSCGAWALSGLLVFAIAIPCPAPLLAQDSSGSPEPASEPATEASPETASSDAKATPPPDMAVRVPPRHWVYRVLRDLASRGLVERYPAFAFEGGRIFTRGELAQITGRLLATARSRKDFSPEDLERVGRLARELNPELKILGIDPTLPAPELKPVAAPDTTAAPEVPTPPAWGITGSNTLRQSAQEGTGNDSWSDRLDIELRMPHVRVRLQGQAEPRPIDQQTVRETGDFGFELGGEKSSFDLTDRSVELTDLRIGLLRSNFIVGTVDNVSAGNGLVLGATDILTGAKLDLNYGESTDVVLFYGETPPPREDLGFWRAVHRLTPRFQLGASLLRVEDDRLSGPGGRRQERTAGGTDLSVALGPLEVSGEAARTEGGIGRDSGEAYYASSRLRGLPGIDLDWAWRNYRKFGFEFNNAPIYAGTSGGDDSDELGWSLASAVRPGAWLPSIGLFSNIDFRFVMDRSQKHRSSGGTDPVTGKILTAGDTLVTDYRGEMNYRLGQSTSVGGSYELESPENPNGGRATTHTHIVSGRASHTVGPGFGRFEGWNIGVDFNRDWDIQTIIETYRLNLKVPLAQDRHTVSLSDTFRQTKDRLGTSPNRYENDLQLRWNWKISPSTVFSARGTLPDSNTGDESGASMDMTLIIRF